MEQGDFKEFRKKVFDFYFEGKFKDALDIAEKAHAKFKEKISETSYWLACLNSVLHNDDKAVGILLNSLNDGFWWSPKRLETEKDFDSRNREDFKQIVEKCAKVFEEKQEESKPKRLVFYPYEFAKIRGILFLSHCTGKGGMQTNSVSTGNTF